MASSLVNLSSESPILKKTNLFTEPNETLIKNYHSSACLNEDASEHDHTDNCCVVLNE